MEHVCTCRIDELGRIVLPKEIREKCCWKPWDVLTCEVEGRTLIMKSAEKDLRRNEIFCSADELF